MELFLCSFVKLSSYAIFVDIGAIPRWEIEINSLGWAKGNGRPTFHLPPDRDLGPDRASGRRVFETTERPSEGV